MIVFGLALLCSQSCPLPEGEFSIVTSCQVGGQKARRPSALPRFCSPRTFFPTSTSLLLRAPLRFHPHPYSTISIPLQAQQRQDPPASFLSTEISQHEVLNHARRWRTRLLRFCPEHRSPSLWCMLIPPPPSLICKQSWLSAHALLVLNGICCSDMWLNG